MSDNDIVETASVWEAISDAPGEAYNRQLRADLMTAIRGQIDRFGWSQVTAAQNLGVTQPRLSDLYRGKLSKFSLDAWSTSAAKLESTSGCMWTPTNSPAADRCRRRWRLHWRCHG